MRPFTLLASVQDVLDAAALTDLARRAERLGYTGLVVPDHLIPQLSPIPAMTAIAMATTTLRVGTFVLNNDLRHPAVLAQDLASVDVLSGGRLDVAVGAGWRQEEYDAIGLPFDDGPTRVSRLEEAVAVLQGCFGEGPFSFDGRHYRITDFDAHPKPVQRPRPPLLVGGGGRRILSLAGREADVVGLAPRTLATHRVDPRSITWAATAEKIAWARAAAGDQAADLVFNVYPSGRPPLITDETRATAREIVGDLGRRTGVELSEDEAIASPHLWFGSVSGLVEKALALRAELGVTSLMLGDVDELAPVVERLAGT